MEKFPHRHRNFDLILYITATPLPKSKTRDLSTRGRHFFEHFLAWEHGAVHKTAQSIATSRSRLWQELSSCHEVALRQPVQFNACGRSITVLYCPKQPNAGVSAAVCDVIAHAAVLRYIIAMQNIRQLWLWSPHAALCLSTEKIQTGVQFSAASS